MAYNPKSLLNLKRIPKGTSGNPKGRPKTLAGAIKSIPKDAKTRVLEVLHHAIALRNVKEAKAYLESDAVQDELPEYGFLLQLALKSLISKTGWLTAVDIMDRLFGKPRQEIQADLTLDMDEAPVIVFSSGAQQEEPPKTE